MPRTQRNAETDGYKPLINFEKTAYEKLSLKLSEPVVMNLKAYAAYVERTPSVDDIVDKGMQRLFDADKGFRNWLLQQNGAQAKSENAATESENAATEIALPSNTPMEPASAASAHAGD